MSEVKPYTPYKPANAEGSNALESHEPSPRAPLNGWGAPNWEGTLARDQQSTTERNAAVEREDVK